MGSAVITLTQWKILVICFTSNWFSSFLTSLQGPLYPILAEDKGLSAALYGIVFAVYQFILFLAGFMFGAKVGIFGMKRCMVSGLFLISACAMGFGFLTLVKSNLVFLVLSVILRGIEGFGRACYYMGSQTLITNTFRNRVSGSIGLLQLAFGLGLFCGPVVGGAIYSSYGFTAPFLSAGILLTLYTLLVYWILPPDVPEPEATTFLDTQATFGKIMRIPGIWVGIQRQFISSMGIGFLLVCLANKIRSFNLSPNEYGLMFVIQSSMFGLLSPFYGWLIDKIIHPRFLLIYGATLQAIGMLLIGPAPFLNLPSHLDLSLCIGGLFLSGIGGGADSTATYTDPLRVAKRSGLEQNTRLYGRITSLWRAAFSLGGMVGPGLGGVLATTIGFGWYCVILSVLHLASGSFIVCFVAYEKDCTPQDTKDNNSETKPLISKITK